MKDPFVQEVRKYRMEHTKRFNGDLQRICGDLRQFEQTLGDRVVTLVPRNVQPTRGCKRLAKDRSLIRAQKVSTLRVSVKRQ